MGGSAMRTKPTQDLFAEMEEINETPTIEILGETFNKDFDDIAYEPEVISGDNDEEAAEFFGFNN